MQIPFHQVRSLSQSPRFRTCTSNPLQSPSLSGRATRTTGTQVPSPAPAGRLPQPPPERGAGASLLGHFFVGVSHALGTGSTWSQPSLQVPSTH